MRQDSICVRPLVNGTEQNIADGIQVSNFALVAEKKLTFGSVVTAVDGRNLQFINVSYKCYCVTPNKKAGGHENRLLTIATG